MKNYYLPLEAGEGGLAQVQEKVLRPLLEHPDQKLHSSNECRGRSVVSW